MSAKGKSGDGSRPARVAERIRQELMMLLLGGAVKDPAVVGVVVQAVQVTRDLGIAKVYVRSTEPDAREEAVVRGLQRASGFLRRSLGPALAIRRTPELRFYWDETPERAARMEEILDELRTERGPADPANSDGDGS